MKHILTLATLFISCIAKAQFGENIQAFDCAIHYSLNSTAKADLSSSLSVGASGRRIPVSLFVGANFMQLENDFQKLGYKSSITTGFNVTAMLRLCHIDFRSMDLNAYSTLYKEHNKYFLEYGFKTGILLNDRTRMYAHMGYIYCNNTASKEYRYGTINIGASFSLFFFNGYDAY
jgi:hypothetical protein